MFKPNNKGASCCHVAKVAARYFISHVSTSHLMLYVLVVSYIAFVLMVLVRKQALLNVQMMKIVILIISVHLMVLEKNLIMIF